MVYMHVLVVRVKVVLGILVITAVFLKEEAIAKMKTEVPVKRR